MTILDIALTIVTRECWVNAGNLRYSAVDRAWGDQSLFALAITYIGVAQAARQNGYCRNYLSMVEDHARYDMVIVECVQNDDLAHALVRRGWSFNLKLRDFYFPRSSTAKSAVAKAKGG